MTTVLVTLIQNTALLLAMMVVFDLVTSQNPVQGQWQRQALAGVILGGLCIGLMMASFQHETGIIFDTRSVLLSLSGLFLGLIPTVLAMGMAAAYRFWHGGTGIWTGIGVILATGGIGILWRHYRPGRLADISVQELYGFGLIVHLVMLSLMLTLPWEAAQRVISGIGLPVLLVFPLATIALGWLLAARLQRENATATLAASETRYRSLFEAANVGKSVTLPTGEIEVNQAFCDMLGYSPDELRGKTWQELTPVQEIGPINELLAPLMRGEKNALQFEKHYIHKNGSYVPADISITLQRGGDGSPLYFITTVVNITERKQAQDLLEQQKTQLEQRNRVLKQFNSAVSHELKTPLVSIESSLGLIQRTLPQTMDPELARAFGYARTATRQMNNLLESLLLMFRIDVADSDTVTTAFGVLVQDAVDRLTRGNKLKGIRLTITAEGPELCGDRDKLVQIWLPPRVRIDVASHREILC